ncbi:MAG: HAMP domain-containing sensor histidine kinase [Vicinamibacterales bacterium]
MGFVAALGLAAAAAPITVWRTAARTTGTWLGLGAVLVALAAGAGGLASLALTVAPPWAAGAQRALAALVVLAFVALVAPLLSRWLALRGRARWTPPSRLAGRVAGLATGLVAGLLAARHRALLAALLPDVAPEVLRASLLPTDVPRMAGAAALVFVHAAVLLALATAMRVAWGLAVPRRRAAWALAFVPAAIAAALTAWIAQPGASSAARATSLLLVAGTLAALAALDGTTRVLRRGTQPVRLLVLLAWLALPALVAYPSLAVQADEARHADVAGAIAPDVAGQRQALQASLRAALSDIDAAETVADLVRGTTPTDGAAVPADAAFLVWTGTTLAARRLTSSVELYDGAGRLSSRFALNLPETAVDTAWRETSCGWEVFEEVSPFFAEERRLLHAGRGICEGGQVIGSVVVHVVLDYANLPFLAAQNPYVALLGGVGRDPSAREDLAFVVYGWSRRPLYVAGGEAWPLPEEVFARLTASREPFWATLEDRGVVSDVYVLSDRGAIYAIGVPRLALVDHVANLAALLAWAAVLFTALVLTTVAGARLTGLTPLSGRALLREVRASFSRTLFVGFVAAVAVPVVALALVTRTSMAASLREDVEREAARTVLSASRVIEDFAALESRGTTSLPALDDSLLVWLSRVIGEDINVFAGSGLRASSERNLFASGLLPTRTPGETYRALVLDGRPTFLAREAVGAYEYRVASALVRVGDEQVIVSVPLTLRQRGIERQVDALDRRVLLAAIAFILLGSFIGYWAAERISDPVSRLTRATRRLASGDLDAHVLVRTSDELGRLVEAFNGMADDLRRQRTQLERTNRLEAWAEMARQVAHDIKNPLTPIQLNAEHLRRVHEDRGRPLGTLVDDCVANILLQVRLLRQLSAEFSSFASAPQARPTAVPLAPLLDEILAPYASALAGRIVIAHEGAEDATLFVDRVLLARALTNVIENALHAMPGSGSLVVRTQPPSAGTVRLDVVDTGVGMDAEALGRIFEPYFSTKATGTGLGLTIARRNVELNGGTIAVASTRGVGTTVSLTLPLAASG